MVGARAPGTEQIFATCVVFLLDKGKRSKSREGVREGLAWRSGGCKGFGCGGVGGRGTGPRDGANFATYVVFLSFLTRTKRRKMAFFEGCPVGWGGGVPTGAGLVDGGVDHGLGGERLGPPNRLGGGSGRRGKSSGGGCKGFGSGGVGGRGTGPRNGFLKDGLWWGGGVPTGAGLVDGGIDQGPWLREGRWQFQRRGRVGGCSSKEEQVQGRGQGRVGLAVGGGARASVAGG